jgi:REP element-mobilizing transposase RayT
MNKIEAPDLTKGCYKRFNLPHFDVSGLYQMITYRLNDSLPKSIVEKMIGSNEKEKRKEIESYLDQGHGSCLLTNEPKIANMIIENWKFFEHQKYDLISYVVMPNHVHVIIKAYDGVALSSVIHSWKSYTSGMFKKISGQLDVPGWQSEYWDRYIRDEKHFGQAVEYILHNPVKANLCKESKDWPYSYCKENFIPESNERIKLNK